MLLNILQCARQSPTTKNYLPPNVSVLLEKPCFKGISTILGVIGPSSYKLTDLSVRMRICSYLV